VTTQCPERNGMQLRFGGKYYVYFVGNFMRLTAVKEL